MKKRKIKYEHIVLMRTMLIHEAKPQAQERTTEECALCPNCDFYTGF